MTNNVLALVIVVVTFGAMYTRASMPVLLGALAIIGAILAFVSFSAAQIGDFGPAMGVGAFVLTFALIYFFRRNR